MKHQISIGSCKQCYLCIEICPASVYGKSESGETIVLPGMDEVCIVCGHCMAVCETKSIHVDGLSYELNFPDLPANTADYESFKAFFRTGDRSETLRINRFRQSCCRKLLIYLPLPHMA